MTNVSENLLSIFVSAHSVADRRLMIEYLEVVAAQFSLIAEEIIFLEPVAWKALEAVAPTVGVNVEANHSSKGLSQMFNKLMFITQ